MAVGNSNSAAYYSITNGKICRQFKSPTANTKERVNMNGKLVYEEFYDYIDGIISNIETRDSEYGKSWSITLNDEGQSQILQFNYSSGYANSFLKSLPNVDLSQKVKLVPKLTMDGEKKKTTLFINQNNTPVKWAFTKDNPGEMPPLKKIKVKGKETWDDSECMEFLENMVKTQVMPEINRLRDKKNLEIFDAAPVGVTVDEDEEAPF